MATAAKTIFRELKGDGLKFYGALGSFGLAALFGLVAAYYMETNGHHVTGMNNQIVWGMPHVFAVFLIVAASGALNVASIGSVFGKTAYKPLARLSGLVAIALLVGGLAVLVLDLGRPDRLIVAMTTYNFKSIFAWNIYLYIGFLAMVAVYLWMMMEQRMNRYSHTVGVVAFIWRLALTTGTGSIFGFLVARQSYDAAVFAPLFIAMSFALGLAVFILVLVVSCATDDRLLGDYIVNKLGRLLGVFVAAVLYFVVVQHLTNLYAAEHLGVERFILLEGGSITALFWVGQIALGGLLPLVLLFHPALNKSRSNIYAAAGLVILGGLAQIYVIIIGGQSYPLVLFSGMEVKSSFFDGVVNSYLPSLPELILGIGGIAMAGLIIMIGMKVLRFLPDSLADNATDPHFKETP
ncbi:MAG: polysulfide reductase NrfD [Rhodospirillales bacterium]|nr:polysulfide reductase NrfD [Rhodospirillales bacterium]